MQPKILTKVCPCGGTAYESCCGRFHAGQTAGTAEQLMRSRYSAYVLGDAEYLYQSWHASTRPSLSDLQLDPAAKWLGLEVKNHVEEGNEASVEFVARYKTGGRAHRLHEVSRFLREGGRWFYVDGQFPAR